MEQVLVIGGGAAGLAAAYSAAKSGHRVTLVEQNDKLGKKIYITGKGRCNVTNDTDQESFLRHVVSNPKFLYSAIYTFGPQELKELLEEAGLPLKTERGNRVFPVSDHASDVTKTWEILLRGLSVEILLNTRVTSITKTETRVTGVMTENVKTHAKKHLSADYVILATGGVSYPLTGADGSGLRMAKALGHTVTELSPALVGLKTAESFVAEISGLTLKNVGVSIKETSGKKKTVYEDFGELLFTHHGVSGPTILSASSRVTSRLSKGETFSLSIDLKPALDTETLDNRLLRDFSDNPNKKLKNILGGLVPQSLTDIVMNRAEISGDRMVFEVTREERMALISELKSFRLTVNGTMGFNEAIITQGGVSVKEISSSSMKSKQYENLYFAGEMIDLDAETGGYNLQIAWSTGMLAGNLYE